MDYSKRKLYQMTYEFLQPTSPDRSYILVQWMHCNGFVREQKVPSRLAHHIKGGQPAKREAGQLAGRDA